MKLRRSAIPHCLGPYIRKITACLGGAIPAKQRHLLPALILSLLLHFGLLAFTGGGEQRGKSFTDNGSLPPSKHLSLSFIKALVQSQSTATNTSTSEASIANEQPLSDDTTPTNAGEGSRSALATPIVESSYYPTTELSVKPIAKAAIPIEPEGVPIPDAGGKIELTLWINEHGFVEYVAADSTTMPNDLTEAVRQAFAQAQFIPGEKDHHAVRSQYKVVIDYKPLDVIRLTTPIKKK